MGFQGLEVGHYELGGYFCCGFGWFVWGGEGARCDVLSGIMEGGILKLRWAVGLRELGGGSSLGGCSSAGGI